MFMSLGAIFPLLQLELEEIIKNVFIKLFKAEVFIYKILHMK